MFGFMLRIREYEKYSACKSEVFRPFFARGKSSKSDIGFSTLRSMQKRPIVLWIGALVEHKGPLEVIEVARALPEMEFVMIGSPWDSSILDRLMKEKTSNLSYLGPVSNRSKNTLIRLSCAGITTSKYEGFGWVPFEFLIAGKPVLAYPLPVFREVYGDLIEYADDVTAFIRQLSEMHRKGFKVKIDSAKVAELQRRLSIPHAASRIVRLLNLKSLVIFSRDYEEDSPTILGCDIVAWKLWRSLSDKGIQMQIFANGAKYSTGLHLASQTIRIGRHLAFLRVARMAMNKNPWLSADSIRSGTQPRIAAKILDLTLHISEPLSYAFGYMKHKTRMRSLYIATCSQPSTILAGIIMKRLFGCRLICLIHDTGFYDIDLPKSSFPMKIYYTIFVRCLRYVDRIITVSRKTQRDLSRFCDLNRILLLRENVEV